MRHRGDGANQLPALGRAKRKRRLDQHKPPHTLRPQGCEDRREGSAERVAGEQGGGAAGFLCNDVERCEGEPVRIVSYRRPRTVPCPAIRAGTRGGPGLGSDADADLRQQIPI